MELENKQNVQHQPLTSELIYPSNYVDILGSKIHYLDVGHGKPILFLHGVPTWSYLWRNIIPAVSDLGRCIAPDLIGFGYSDKPAINYRIFDHIRYIENFIETLDLRDITLVLHGWGSVIGFDYATRNPERIKGIAFIESYLHPVYDWKEMALPLQEMASIFSLADKGREKILSNNAFIQKMLQAATVRTLKPEEINAYLAPFSTQESRLPVWQFFCDAPVPGGPKDVIDLIETYCQKLQSNLIPKLMLYAIPGFITCMKDVQWAQDHLPNLTTMDIGDGHHYIQEGNPIALRIALREWILENIYD